MRSCSFAGLFVQPWVDLEGEQRLPEQGALDLASQPRHTIALRGRQLPSGLQSGAGMGGGSVRLLVNGKVRE